MCASKVQQSINSANECLRWTSTFVDRPTDACLPAIHDWKIVVRGRNLLKSPFIMNLNCSFSDDIDDESLQLPHIHTPPPLSSSSSSSSKEYSSAAEGGGELEEHRDDTVQTPLSSHETNQQQQKQQHAQHQHQSHNRTDYARALARLRERRQLLQHEQALRKEWIAMAQRRSDQVQ